MPDKNKTESIAVIAIKNAFAQIDCILDHILTEDKTPYVDGYLSVYEGDTDHKDNFIGNIDVQVKGRNSKQVKSSRPKFGIPISDLKKYQTVFHGVLYFLVSVGNDCQSKGIYYRQLLPYDIAKILQPIKNDDQKKAAVRFKPLPEQDPFFLKKLCLEFLDNREKQFDVNCIRLATEEGFSDDPIKFDRYETGRRFSDINDPLSLRTWIGESYLYGVTKSGQYFALGKIENVAKVGGAREATIKSGGYSCSVRVAFGEDAEGHYFKFGSFEFRFDPEPCLHYTPQGTFSERLRDVRIMEEVLITKTLEVDGRKLFRGIGFIKDPTENILSNKAALEDFEKLSQIMHFKIDWDPSGLSKHELGDLSRLSESIIHSNPVPLNGLDGNLINLNMNIQDSRIKVLAKRNDHGLYNLIDPMHERLVAYIPGAEEGDEFEREKAVPGLFILNKDDLQKAANLDPIDFGNSLDSIPITKQTESAATIKLLEMLCAFDDGAVCDNQLIQCAEVLAERLNELNPESEASIINCAQIKKRKGTLTEADQEQLRGLALDSEDMAVKTSAYLLLNQHDFANKVFGSLPERKQEEFLTWPIAHFFDF